MPLMVEARADSKAAQALFGKCRGCTGTVVGSVAIWPCPGGQSSSRKLDTRAEGICARGEETPGGDF